MTKRIDPVITLAEREITTECSISLVYKTDFEPRFHAKQPIDKKELNECIDELCSIISDLCANCGETKMVAGPFFESSNAKKYRWTIHHCKR